MKPYKHKNKNVKKLLFIILLLLLIMMGIFGYLFLTGRIFSTKQSNTSKSIDANKDGSNGTSTVPGTTTTNGDNKTIIPSDSTTTPQTDIEKPTITRSNQSGTSVRISAIFSKPAYGDCVLTIEKSGEATITKTTQVVVGPSYYACDGFVLSTASFPSNGDWTITVTHKYNTESIASDPSTLTIQ